MSTIADIHLQDEERNKQKGRIFAAIAGALIIVMLLIPLFSKLNPPPGQEGILISFGEPDVGDGTEQPYTDEEIVEEVEDTQEPLEEVEPVTETSEPEPTNTDEVADVVTDDNSDISIKKESKESKEKAKEETKEKPKNEPKQEPKKETKPKEPEKPKKPLITFPGNKNNTSQGDKNKPGDKGTNDGDPNSDVLDGDKSTGGGTSGTGGGTIGIGGGISGRGVKFPEINNPYNEFGDVVVSVCVDNNGNVTDARTTRGTTTSSSRLKALAVKKAKQFKFESNDIPEQCGTITIKFKPQ